MQSVRYKDTITVSTAAVAAAEICIYCRVAASRKRLCIFVFLYRRRQLAKVHKWPQLPYRCWNWNVNELKILRVELSAVDCELQIQMHRYIDTNHTVDTKWYWGKEEDENNKKKKTQQNKTENNRNAEIPRLLIVHFERQ